MGEGWRKTKGCTLIIWSELSQITAAKLICRISCNWAAQSNGNLATDTVTWKLCQTWRERAGMSSVFVKEAIPLLQTGKLVSNDTREDWTEHRAR